MNNYIMSNEYIVGGQPGEWYDVYDNQHADERCQVLHGYSPQGWFKIMNPQYCCILIIFNNPIKAYFSYKKYPIPVTVQSQSAKQKNEKRTRKKVITKLSIFFS